MADGGVLVLWLLGTVDLLPMPLLPHQRNDSFSSVLTLVAALCQATKALSLVLLSVGSQDSIGEESIHSDGTKAKPYFSRLGMQATSRF